MLLLSLLLPSLIISLPQSISKLPYLPSGIKSAVRHFRGSPTIPGQIASPVEGIPELSPDPSDGNIVIEPLKPTYQPLIYTGKDAWRTFLGDPVGSWEKGDREHVWFLWFSGVDVTEEGEIAAPLVEETEWPAVPGDEEGEFELRRRKLEVGMFQGSHNDEVYRDTAIGIAKQQQQTEWEQEKEARLSASSASKHTKPTSVDQIIFSSDTPTVTPSAYAHFAFVNCNDEEEKQLCYRFLAIEEHRPMLYAIVRNTTIIEPKSVSSTNAEPEVAPLVPGFVHMKEDPSGLKKQSSDDSVINVEIEEKDISEDPIVEETVETELPSPPEPTIIYKLLLRKVPLKENLTITDLHNFYEFKRWEKLPVWDDPLNPADGFVGTAMEGKVGEFIGMGYEYWYKMPKWVFGMTLGLLLRWITVTILDRSQQKRERKKALRAEKKLAESAAAAAARAASPPQTPLKTQAILPNVPKTPEIPVETQAPEEIEVVEHAELAKAEGVASLADVLGKGLASEKTETKPSVESNGDKLVLEADEGESVVEAIEDVPIVETSEDDSVVETNGGKPIGFTNDDRFAVNPNDDKSAVHTHDDRPVVNANDDKPVVHTNDDNDDDDIDDDDIDDDNDDNNDDENDDNNDDENDHNDNESDDENDDNNNDEENDDEEEDDDEENQDRPVIYTNGDSPDHTNEDNLADSMTEDNFDIIDPLKESIMEAKDREPVIETKGGPGIEENDDEPVMEVKEEKSVVDMKEAVGATEDEPVDGSDEDEPIDRSDEDEPVDGTNEDELVDRSDEDELVDRTNEDELVDRSDEDELVDRTPEIKPDVNISPVKPASKTPDTSPVKPVFKSLDTSPVKPAVKTPDTSPMKPVLKSPDTSPVKPVLKSPDTSPVKPVLKSPDTSPVKPIFKSPDTSPLKPVVKSPATSPVKAVVKSPEVKPAEEQIQSLEDLNSMEGLNDV